MIDNNPFLSRVEEEKELDRKFYEAYPRWTFQSCWPKYLGFRTFCLFSFWFHESKTCGINLLNFSVEFNPNHKAES